MPSVVCSEIHSLEFKVTNEVMEIWWFRDERKKTTRCIWETTIARFTRRSNLQYYNILLELIYQSAGMREKVLVATKSRCV